MLNSLYGAIANKHFLYYIPEVAEAITSSGQLAIQWAGNVVNEYLNKVLKTDNFDYIIYCVDGETKIVVNDTEFSIAEFYDTCNSSILEIDRKQIKKTYGMGFKTPSFNVENMELENKRILSVIKSRVKRKLYSIEIDGKKIKVSEDHRFIVQRNGTIQEICAKDLLETDGIILKT